MKKYICSSRTSDSFAEIKHDLFELKDRLYNLLSDYEGTEAYEDISKVANRMSVLYEQMIQLEEEFYLED